MRMLSKKRRKKSIRREDKRDFVKLSDAEGDNLLHLAVVADIDRKTVSAICSAVSQRFGSSGLNSRNNLFQTPLHIASCIGDPELIDILLEFGADIALVDRNIETAIHLAVKYENHNSLKALLAKSNANRQLLDALNANGLSALHLCLRCRAESAQNMIQMIVESGADINVRDGLSGRTPLLQLLINSPNDTVVKNTLISLNADISLPDYSGLKPIDLMQENDIQ